MKDRALIADIHRIAGTELRAGYRTVTRLLRREGWQINEKRVHRIWRQEGLKVPSRQPRKRRRGSASNSSQKLCASHLNHVWTYDCIHDQTDDGRRLKWLPIVDEFSREAMSLEVARSITARDVLADPDRLVAQRGAPEFIRSGNGPEFIADAVKDWIAKKGFKTCFIEPGSPSHSYPGDLTPAEFAPRRAALLRFGLRPTAYGLRSEARRAPPTITLITTGSKNRGTPTESSGFSGLSPKERRR